MRKWLNLYYRIPENMRDVIENATQGFGWRGNSIFADVFGYVMGQAAKDPDTIFGGHSGDTARERHRRFTEEMGGPEPGPGEPHGCNHEHEHDHDHGHDHGHEPVD